MSTKNFLCDGNDIIVLPIVQALRMRPGLYGLTQEEADLFTCAKAHARFPNVPQAACYNGWLAQQHPTKPLGVILGYAQCPDCNADGRFSCDAIMPKTSFSTETVDGIEHTIVTLTYTEE